MIEKSGGNPASVVLTHSAPVNASKERIEQGLVLDDLIAAWSVRKQPGHISTGAQTGEPIVERGFDRLIQTRQHPFGIESPVNEMRFCVRGFHKRFGPQALIDIDARLSQEVTKLIQSLHGLGHVEAALALSKAIGQVFRGN